MEKVNIDEAARRLEELVSRTEAGETFLIEADGVLVACLTSAHASPDPATTLGSREGGSPETLTLANVSASRP